MIEWYNQSMTVRLFNRLFGWMVNIFKNSLIYRLSSEEIYQGSRIFNWKTKSPKLSMVGQWYSHSLLLRSITAFEEVTLTVFKYNRLFQFFLEDEAKYEE
jgi:hypothetical protein